MSKPHGYHKPKIYSTYTYTKERKNPKTTLKLVIKAQEKKRSKKTCKNKPKAIKKIVIGKYISIITLNVNGLNTPIKRHILAGWILK